MFVLHFSRWCSMAHIEVYNCARSSNSGELMADVAFKVWADNKLPIIVAVKLYSRRALLTSLLFCYFAIKTTAISSRVFHGLLGVLLERPRYLYMVWNVHHCCMFLTAPCPMTLTVFELESVTTFGQLIINTKYFEHHFWWMLCVNETLTDALYICRLLYFLLAMKLSALLQLIVRLLLSDILGWDCVILIT